MTTAYQGQPFCLAERHIEGRVDLAVMGEDGLFWFADGDGYSPENIELSFDAVQFLTQYQLEQRLNGEADEC